MKIATLIALGLQASVALNVFCIGLAAIPSDATSLLRRPGILLRAVASIFVVMPLVAVALARAIDPHPAVKIALVTLAVAPCPPIFPRRAIKAGAKRTETVGLLVTAALLAMVVTPLAIDLIARILLGPVRTPITTIVRIVLVTIIAPLTAGLLVRQVAPTFAKRVAGPLATSATVLLVGGVLPILFTTWPAIRSLVGNGTLAGIAAFVLIGLVAGHLLGGPEEDGRTLLALSSASRHPGIAMAAAHADFPQQTLVPAAIMLYLIVSAVVSMPYLSWRRRTRE